MGWRRRIEQAYRFEAALELVRACDGAVLDVGAGLGALPEYAAACGVQREWWAIEPRAAFVRALHAGGRYAHVHAGDFAACELRADCAVAIGVLTAEPTATLDELAAFLAQSRCSMFTVLDREALAARPLLGMEHDAAATTREALESLPEAAQVVRISSTDYARFMGLESAPRTIEERFDATLRGPWSGPPAEAAWLACELGLDARVEDLLRAAPQDDPLAQLVRDRLALSRTRGGGETR